MNMPKHTQNCPRLSRRWDNHVFVWQVVCMCKYVKQLKRERERERERKECTNTLENTKTWFFVHLFLSLTHSHVNTRTQFKNTLKFVLAFFSFFSISLSFFKQLKNWWSLIKELQREKGKWFSSKFN